MKEATYPMRINKYLANQKLTTRRGADELIKKKIVFINDRVAVLGDKVGPKDIVEVREKGVKKPLVYFAYNKPKGVTTQDGANDKIEADKNPLPKDVFPIGGIDKDAHGLVILSNDGRITDGLLSSTHGAEREYLVRTKNTLRPSFKEKMEGGVKIEKERTEHCFVRVINPKAFKVILRGEKKHQVKRMCVALFQEVDDIERQRIENITLSNLPAGKFRKIEGEELENFLEALDLRA